MAGHFDAPSQWRLTSASGIKYKFLGQEGSFESENAGVTWRALIRSSDLIQFVTEMLPGAIQIGNLAFPQATLLPGTNLGATRVSFKSFDDNIPIDPFGFDTVAPSKTYFPVVEINVEFTPLPNSQPNPNDPFTFLEISSNASGEFIHTTIPKGKWQKQKNPTSPGSQDETSTGVDPFTGEPVTKVLPTEGQDGPPEQNKDADAPITIVVPMTEWSVRWKQIPLNFWRNVLVHRLRVLMGRVNAQPFPLLYNAFPETIMLVSYGHQQMHSWRNGQINSPPISLEMKFLEKRVFWDGITHGHNSFWRPEKGKWERLLIDGENPTYKRFNYNLLFKV